MKRLCCPHCGEKVFFTGKLPDEVVAVLACHQCQELYVLFRNRIIPLNKQVLESGTFDERKEHLAEVIAKFLEGGLFSLSPQNQDAESFMEDAADVAGGLNNEKQPGIPITDQEMEHFLRIDLQHLDNPTYFKRIFG